MPTIAYDRVTMSNRSRQETEVVSARWDFARRLRELRILRGFRTARSLARALEIDENRYTRYERAEVEPDLDMIRRICSALTVTPSELLGPQESVTGGKTSGQTRRSSGQRNRTELHGNGSALGIASAAWELAEAVTQTRTSKAAVGQDLSASPLAGVSQTGTLYQLIMKQPFEAISSLLQEPGISEAPTEVATGLRQRIEQLVHLLKTTPAGG